MENTSVLLGMEGALQIKDPDLRARAEDELGETDSVRKAALISLRNLIYTGLQGDWELPDEFLIMFLRTTKFNENNAFARIRRLSELLQHPIAHRCLEKSGLTDIFTILSKIPWVAVSDGVDSLNQKVATVQLGKWDPDIIAFPDLLIVGALTIVSVTAEDKRIQVGGYVLIFDTEGFSMKHAVQFTPSIVRFIAAIIRECCPVRVKKIYFTKVSKIARCIFRVLVPLLGRTIRSRVEFHGDDLTFLKKDVLEEFLPKEYGGTCDDVTQSSYVRWCFEQAEKIGVLPCIRNAVRT